MTYQSLPYKQIFIICVCKFAEPICFSVIFPFIVSMVKDFNISKKEDVGYYVGMITASFSLSQLLTGFPWGMASDRVGRRPVLLFGMMGTIFSITLFGLSKSYAWALISRSLCGLLNGNVGVMKSMVSELTLATSPENRTRAFSFLSLMSGLGYIVGPLLGGFLAKPVEHYPSIFGHLGSVTDFLVNYPYFLPCAISALLCVINFIFALFFLKETLGGSVQLKSKQQQGDEQQEPLLSANTQPTTYQTLDDDDSIRSNKNQQPFLNKNDTVHSSSLLPPPTIKEALTPTVLAISFSFGLLIYQIVFGEELFAIWTASQRSLGGLGFDTNEIGMAMSVAGFSMLVTQLFVLPLLVKRFGFIRLYRAMLFVLIFIYFAQGGVRWLYDVPNWHGQVDTKDWVWVGLLIIVTIKTVAQAAAATSCGLLINNCAPVRSLGTINGFSQGCGAFMGTLAPATCGTLWSISASATWLPFGVRTYINWAFIACVATITFYTGFRLDASKYETVQDQVAIVLHEDDNQNSHRDDTA